MKERLAMSKEEMDKHAAEVSNLTRCRVERCSGSHCATKSGNRSRLTCQIEPRMGAEGYEGGCREEQSEAGGEDLGDHVERSGGLFNSSDQ